MIQRIYHRWEKWEDYPAGFFNEQPPKGMTIEDCQNKYAEFLRDLKLFKKSAYRVIDEWPNATEHNLTNPNMNRIAWIGQSSVCIHYGIPSKYRGGYHLLSEKEQLQADSIALEIINYWMFIHGEPPFTLNTIKSRTEADLY
jgi:hypothetical protein